MRVLILFANARGMSVPPEVVAQFVSILKEAGHTVGLFDTSGFTIPGFTDETKSRQEKLYYKFPDAPPGSDIEKVVLRLKQLAELDVYDEFAKKIQSFSPDLIAASVTESTFLVAVLLLGEIKKRFHDLPPVIFGGVFPTFAPNLAIGFPEVDMLCIGEGEVPLRDLCERMERGEDFTKVSGLWVKNGGTIVKNSMGAALTSEQIDKLPLPDYSLFEDFRFTRLVPVALERYDFSSTTWRTLMIHAMRGCPFECGFCNSPGQNELFDKVNSRFFRKISPERLKAIIEDYIKNYRMNYIFFSDDTFLARSAQELDDLCGVLKDVRLPNGEKIPYWCQSRPETIAPDRDGHKKLQMLIDSGMHWMAFGLEHGDEEFRRVYVKRNYDDKLVIDSMQVARDMGISYSINNIIGFPCETRELLFKTIKLNRKIHPDGYFSNFSASTFVPFSGTNLREVAVKEGFIDPDCICQSNSADSILRMPRPFLQKEEIRILGRLFAMYIRFEESRWPEIQKAEASTPEGEEIRKKLAKEYEERFMQKPETRIDRLSTQPPNKELPLM